MAQWQSAEKSYYCAEKDYKYRYLTYVCMGDTNVVSYERESHFEF